MIFKNDSPIWRSPRNLIGLYIFNTNRQLSSYLGNESATNNQRQESFETPTKVELDEDKIKIFSIENEPKFEKTSELLIDEEAIKQAETCKRWGMIL